MTVYYYEGEQIVAPFSVTSNEPITSSDSISLKQNRFSQGAQRWELSLTIMTKDSEGDHLANIVLNQSTVKTMVMPQLVGVEKRSIKTVPINILCSSSVSSGVAIIPVNENGFSFFLPKGSFIQFSNHSKIYLTTSNYDSSTSSQLSIYPSLRAPVSNSVTIKTHLSTSLPMLNFYRSVDNLPTLIYEDGILVNMQEIKLIEAL